MIVKKREHDHKENKYLIIAFRMQSEWTSIIKWIVIFLIAVVLYVIFFDEGSSFGERGFIIGLGAFIIHQALIIAFDEIQIWFQDGKLVVKYTPIPQYGSPIKLVNIEKAYLKLRSSRYTSNNPWVDLKLKNGKNKKLVVASNVDEAKEIAEEINKALREKRSGMLN